MSAATHKLIKGATGEWEMVIGMEIHAQVTSKSKLFSGASILEDGRLVFILDTSFIRRENFQQEASWAPRY